MNNNNDGNNNIDIASISSNVTKLQAEVSGDTKKNLKIEAIRRGITMGQLIDELAKKMFFVNNQ